MEKIQCEQPASLLLATTLTVTTGTAGTVIETIKGANAKPLS